MFHAEKNVPRSEKKSKITEKKLACGCFSSILCIMKNELKKGHLYFHVANARVERIVTPRHVNGSTVEHRHHNVASVSHVKNFRIATREEVLAYLGK
jgi:hypothetical protein